MSRARFASCFFRASCLVTFALAANMPIAMAFEQARSEYGAPLRLTSLPARVGISSPVPGFSDGGKGALSRAIATWNAIDCSSPALSLSARQDDTALIEVRPIRQGWRFGRAIAAHTDVESDPFQGDIRRVVIEIDANLHWTESAIVPADAFDLETVLLHELGHAVGLEHSRNTRAIMRAGIKPGHVPRRTLDGDDIAGICASLTDMPQERRSLSHVARKNQPLPKRFFVAIGVLVVALGYLLGSGIHSRKRLTPW